MKRTNLMALTAMALFFSSCRDQSNQSDASGVFEAKEIIVSSESSGKILDLGIEEGTNLTAGQLVGSIDCENLAYQKAQVEASIAALSAKRNSADPQVQILREQRNVQLLQLSAQQEQLKVLEKEANRFRKLVDAQAVPTKQYDDLTGKVDVLKKNIIAAESGLKVLDQQIKSAEEQIDIANRGLMSERKPLEERVSQFDNMLGKCQIINPVEGTVLTKYAETNEVTSMGKALYKLADLSVLKLRAYITNDQLSKVKLNQAVTVLVDNGEDGFKELPGEIEWISSKAEFTPKTIQTKDERSNLVYATKIRVKNDGFLKIGMYGEVKF